MDKEGGKRERARGKGGRKGISHSEEAFGLAGMASPVMLEALEPVNEVKELEGAEGAEELEELGPAHGAQFMQ